MSNKSVSTFQRTAMNVFLVKALIFCFSSAPNASCGVGQKRPALKIDKKFMELLFPAEFAFLSQGQQLKSHPLPPDHLP